MTPTARQHTRAPGLHLSATHEFWEVAPKPIDKCIANGYTNNVRGDSERGQVMERKRQINFRASGLTARQLDVLAERWGTTQSETITIVVDRVYQHEAGKGHNMISYKRNDDGAIVDVVWSQTVDAYDGRHHTGAIYRRLTDITLSARDLDGGSNLGNVLSPDDAEWWEAVLTDLGTFRAWELEHSPEERDALARAEGYDHWEDMTNNLSEGDLESTANRLSVVLRRHASV